MLTQTLTLTPKPHP